MLKVAAIQHHCDSEHSDNLNRCAELIRQAASAGAQLVVLQELHALPYFCQTTEMKSFNLAESIPGPTSEYLANLAIEHQLVIVGSVFERRAPGLYHNTAVVIEKDGKLAGKYRKMHIPDDPGYHEKYYFTPGDSKPTGSFTPIHTSVGKLGVLVCWDQWFPEAARLMALAGADVLIYPTAIGWDSRDNTTEQQKQLDAWITIQRAHAIANNLPVIVSNRCGFEHDPSGKSSGIEFWGSGFICGPQGEVLAQSGPSGDTIISANLDWQQTEDTRRVWPYLRDRRIDAYDQLTQRFIK